MRTQKQILHSIALTTYAAAFAIAFLSGAAELIITTQLHTTPQTTPTLTTPIPFTEPTINPQTHYISQTQSRLHHLFLTTFTTAFLTMFPAFLTHLSLDPDSNS